MERIRKGSDLPKKKWGSPSIQQKYSQIKLPQKSSALYFFEFWLGARAWNTWRGTRHVMYSVRTRDAQKQWARTSLKTFSTMKNSPFPLTQSIKVHRRAQVLLTCLILCYRCESRNSHHLIMQRDNIHARTHDTCVGPRGYITSGWCTLF